MSNLSPTAQTSEDPNELVRCRICNAEKETRQMGGHLGKMHKGVNMARYIDTYGPEAATDFYIHRNGGRPKPDATPTSESKKSQTIEDELLQNLTSTEKKFYHDFSQEVFQQIDRDIVQWPMVMSLALDMVHLNRCRSGQVGKKGEKLEAKVVEALAADIKNTEARIRAQMDSLGISRAAKQKNKAQVKSTPFSLISGYFDELQRMTPEQHQVMENEERKQLREAMDARIAKLYLSVAPDIEEKPGEDLGTISSLALDRVIADSGVEL